MNTMEMIERLAV